MVHFTTISGHFLANPFNNFHKTEALLIQNDQWNLSFVKDIKGIGQKWPEMVAKWTIVTTRLGESVFTWEATAAILSRQLLP